MNKPPSEQRSKIQHLLCDGMSIRAVTRLTGASKNTVAKLLNDAGMALEAYQGRAFRDLICEQIQKTLKMSPAMSAGVETRLWEMSDRVAIFEAKEKAPGKRGPYKTRGA